MQVDSRLPPGVYHGHLQTQVNGTHSASRPNYSPSSTAHSRDSDMHPYPQHPYAGGPPASQPRQYSTTQLPPMYPGMGVPSVPGQPGPSIPGPSNVPHSLTYNPNAAAPYQPSTQSIQRQDQQGAPALSAGGSNGKYNFELKVEQEPQRARMCGFGDKDRRPITPPPCIRLIVTDSEGNIVLPAEMEGNFAYVLQVDLWDQNATREVNIVRSSSNSPAVSISTATTTSYPPIPDRPPQPDYGRPIGYTAEGQALFPAPHGYPPGTVVPYPNTGYSAYYSSPYGNAGPAGPGAMSMAGDTSRGAQTSHGMYTRNLIGSLTVNASQLKDPDGEDSLWFVLQDLSVRTEGFFRLKMTFFDVANPKGEGVNKGKAPVLAYVFSEQFQVYSAKKFPGVIESTPLSKCFAQQGIKIPIRKDLRMEEVGDDD